MENDMARPKRKKRASVGVLFWIAFLLFVAVVFLYNKQNIEQVLESTGLVEVIADRVGGSDGERPRVTRGDEEPEETETEETEDTEDTEETDEDVRDPDVELEPVVPEDEPEVTTEDSAGRDDAAEESPAEPSDPADSSEEPGSQEEGEDDSEVRSAEESGDEDEEGVRRRTSRIYFIRVTDDGKILPQQVERTVSYQNSPMTQTIRTLLEGPTTGELNQDLLNLIPEDTRLISAAVDEGVAYLNFNEAFRFNPMGVEGFVAQLQQVTYTTTEFSTVDRVQILIEGERLDYLGGDGIYIGEPISRNSFG